MFTARNVGEQDSKLCGFGESFGWAREGHASIRSG